MKKARIEIDKDSPLDNILLMMSVFTTGNKAIVANPVFAFNDAKQKLIAWNKSEIDRRIIQKLKDLQNMDNIPEGSFKKYLDQHIILLEKQLEIYI